MALQGSLAAHRDRAAKGLWTGWEVEELPGQHLCQAAGSPEF